MTATTEDTVTVGVVIVTYASADVITECLASLLTSTGVRMRIVVCDNASPDETVSSIRAWATQSGTDLKEVSHEEARGLSSDDLGPVTLVQAGRNLGFAGAVNIGLETLRQGDGVALFWIVNPDLVVQPDTAAAFVRRAAEVPDFGLMGGRIIYTEAPNVIQSDAGVVNRKTGICRNVNQGVLPSEAAWPDETGIDFISGASLVASRTFVESVGLMESDYFLYYEEVDWAFRRGDMPIVLCRDAIVHHHGGTSIGTGSVTRRSSAFANYFNFRNRMRFMRRFSPAFLPMAYLNSTARICKIALSGGWIEAWGAFKGLNGLAPPKEVAARVDPASADLAFRS